MKGTNKTLIVIYGPTAIGKTKLAIELAHQHKTEIISADSRQFFKEMRIGTAVPNAEELNVIPHHFIQHISIHDNYNVGLYEMEVTKKISALFQTYDTLILVGGSGLYIDAVCYGLDDFPDIDPDLRQSLRKQFSENGLDWLREEVRRLDPLFFQSSDLHNHQRLLRCLEVCLQSGQSFSQFKKKKNIEKPFDIQFISIKMEREILYERIDQRVDTMIENGLLQEAEQLRPFQHLNALQTVGYKELFAYFNNETDLESAIELIKRNSRRFAKRQLTWLKKYPMEWV